MQLSAFKCCTNKIVAIAVCAAVIAAPLPRAASPGRPAAANPAPSHEHFLRDAVPASGFVAAVQDTTDDVFLPEEKSTKQLAWEIAAWIVGAAIVAFFIIKVFIEEDKEESKGGGSTKPDPF